MADVYGNLNSVAVEMTRVSDTNGYAANDAVNDSTSAPTIITVAGLVRDNQGTAYIVGCRLTTDKKSITPRFRVHLYNASNPTIPNDNAGWQDRYADESKYLGYFDLPAMFTGADSTNSTSSYAQDMTLRHAIGAAASTRTIYALLETLDVFTPASAQKFTLRLWCDAN